MLPSICKPASYSILFFKVTPSFSDHYITTLTDCPTSFGGGVVVKSRLCVCDGVGVYV